MKLNWQQLLGTMVGDIGYLEKLVLEAAKDPTKLPEVEKVLDEINDRFKEVIKDYHPDTPEIQ